MDIEDRDPQIRLDEISAQLRCLLEQAESELNQGRVSEATLADLIDVYRRVDQLYAEVNELAEDALEQARKHLGSTMPREPRTARRAALDALIRENSALIKNGLCDYRQAVGRGDRAPKLMHDIIGTQQKVKGWREELIDLNGAELLEIRHLAAMGGSSH